MNITPMAAKWLQLCRKYDGFHGNPTLLELKRGKAFPV